MLKSHLTPWAFVEVLESRIAPATLLVTTIADDGPGSLRQAILDANTMPGADSIGFDIPGDGLHVISLASPLPTITDKVLINNLSGGFDVLEGIRIDGTAAGDDAIGLTISADDCVIAGIQIANFSSSGILIDGGSRNFLVKTQVFSNGLHGLHISGGERNEIVASSFGVAESIPESEGNLHNGILIEGSDQNRIAWRDFTGANIGILFPPSTSQNPGGTMSQNGLFGIEVRGGENNVIAGNVIGGNGAMAGSLEDGGGIAVFDSKAVSIGTSMPYSVNLFITSYPVVGNTILSNNGHGILIQGEQSTQTLIAGNTITANLGGDGIRIDGAFGTNFGMLAYESTPRGGSSWMVGNTITQHAGWGIAVVDGAEETSIRASAISNNLGGGIIFDHALNATVGGLNTYDAGNGGSSSDANTINSGTGTGVLIRDSSGVRILGSNAFVGTGTPIDLGGDGPTPNDTGDSDTGANNLQNYPTLILNPGKVTATIVTDAANTKFRIQAYLFNSSENKYIASVAGEVTTGPDGTATLTLSDPSIATGQQFFATATNLATGETSELSSAAIVNPGVSVSSTATVIEGNSGTQNAVFTISLDAPTTVPVTVGFRTIDSGVKVATAGEDYGAVDGFVVFAPGETSKSVSVAVFGDPIGEATESFSFRLTSVENGLFLSSLATGTIINDDGIPTISIQDVTTSEGVSPSLVKPGYSEVRYTLSLSNGSLDPVTVAMTATGGNAQLGSDYDSINRTITFAPGVTSVTTTFYIKNDSLREEAETIQLQLSAPTAATLADSSSVLTIVDDDTWMIQADQAQMVEGNDGQNFAVMTVRLVNSFGATTHDHPISVAFATEGITATTGSDYLSTQGTLTFEPGEFEKTISIPLIGDNTAEQNESLQLRFSAPFGATLQQATQALTILNDDAGQLSIGNANIAEGQDGETLLVFNVILSVPTTDTVLVGFATQDGTAIAGVDFGALTGELSFMPGETQKTIAVPIYGDRIPEGNESLTLQLTSASGATISTAAAAGTILNDDPTISIDSAQFVEGQSPTPTTRIVYLPVRLSQATDIPLSVDFSTSNGTADGSYDYVATSGTLNFAAGQTLQYIALEIVSDLVLEPDETFSVTLSNPVGAQIAQPDGIVTIQADEPFISSAAVSIGEGNTGTRLLIFTVTLSQTLSSTVTLDYATADGLAIAGIDYMAVTGTLVFAPGERIKTVAVPILGDRELETDETISLLFTGPSGAILAQTDVIGTIVEDELSHDVVGLVISKGGKKATWTDGDGDLVKLVSNKPILTADTFTFSTNGDLEYLNVSGSVKSKASLLFSVNQSVSGDGLIDVGRIDAANRDISQIKIPGRLGAISVGNANLKTPAIGHLSVDSFGLDLLSTAAENAPLLSEVQGKVGRFIVRGNFAGASLTVAWGSIEALIIGGDLLGNSSDHMTGITVDGGLKKLVVRGDIHGTNPEHPVEIRLGNQVITRKVEALGTATIGGDVTNVNLLMGNHTAAPVRVGKVLVSGHWSASNLAVGAGAGLDGLFGTSDDVALQDTASRIAKIRIGGGVTGTPAGENATDHFGIVAGRIAALQVGSHQIQMSKWKEAIEMSGTLDVTVRELAGSLRP